MRGPEKESIKPRGLRDYLLARGRPVITLPEASELLNLPKREAARALLRLRGAGEMFVLLGGCTWRFHHSIETGARCRRWTLSIQ